MKKFLAMSLILIGGLAIMSTQMLSNGKRVGFTFPDGLTASKTFLFPTFDLKERTYTAADTVVVKELYTYLKVDSLKGTYTVELSVQSHISAGATFYVQLGRDTTNRTFYLKQAGVPIDTITVYGAKVKRWYLYNGTKYEKFN